MTHAVSVVIPYHHNETGLAFLLGLLQAQLVPPEKIIIVDTSDNKSGLSISRRYFAHNTPVIVEYAKGATIYQAWNKGIDIAEDTHILFLNDDVVVPMNLIDLLAVTIEAVPSYAIVPTTPAKTHYSKRITKPFEFYAPIPQLVVNTQDLSPVDWMPGFAFMLSRDAIRDVGRFDEDFRVWYGDDDYQSRIVVKYMETGIVPIIRMNNVFVYHYGGSSYKYNNDAIKKQIEKDQIYFIEKWKALNEASQNSAKQLQT